MAQGPSPYASLKPSERDLDFVAGEAGGNWRSLLTHLGIKFPEIQRLFSKNDKDSRVACFEGLFTWLSSEVNNPEEPVTFGTLFQALREAKMVSCASLLEEKLEARSAHKPATGGDLSAQPGTSKSKENPAMANSSSKDHNTAENQPTMPPSATPVEDQRTLALREAHKKLKKFYTKPAKSMTHGKVQFINLALAERPTYVGKTKKDVKEFLEATARGIDRYSRSKKTIEYTTILSNTGNDSGKRVLISGSPGSGKTTLAHQLCRDLYSGHLPNQYQLVLFTELKAFKSYTNKENKKASLLTLLEYSGLDEADRLCSMIEKKEGRGVAIILDGYDEVSDGSYNTLTEWVSEVFCDAPSYLKVSECDVFLTTRHSQLSFSSKASVYLEILGFSSSDIKCYIKDYFKGAPDRAEEVIRRLTGLPLVRGLCSNPRVLEIACKVLKHLGGEEDLPANLSGIFLKYLCYQLEVDLTKRQPPIKTRIKDLLSVSKELFPGFYTLCSLAYDCCLCQQLMPEKQELGDVKEYINSRGSVYNLLFGEEVHSPSEMSCVLYQCDHKTVMEALAAVHIAVLSPVEQQQIWDKWFTAPHMAQVWMMYCGLTGLKSVDFRRLCSLTVSERSREVAKDLESEALLSEDKLVMVSLFEASNNEEAKRVLPVLLKNTVRGYVRSQHDVLCLAYSITHHHHLSRVGLRLCGDCSEQLDLQPLTTSLKNVKAVELSCKKMQQIQAVLPEAVEELSLNRDRDGFEISYKGLGDALRDYHCLRSLTIDYGSSTTALILLTELGSVLNSSRLTEFHLKSCGALIRPAADKQRSLASSMETLKNLLVHLEKCSLEMELNDPQISAVLSGLKRADKLKELELNIKPSDPEVNPNQWLVTCDEVKELVATHPHLVKVDVNSTTKSICNMSDLLIVVTEGAIRNENITHLGLGQYETPAVHHLLGGDSPSADHITSIRGWYHHRGYDYGDDDDDDDGDARSESVIAGPMARHTCHLDLWGFTPASLGLLLSKVNTATKLKDLSWKVHFTTGDHKLVDVRAVETAFTNCSLHQLRIEHNGRPPAQWGHLYSAILNGLAANTTAQVDSCIYGPGLEFHVEEITRHLSQQTLQRFEVVKTGRWSLIISRDPSCPSDNKLALEKAIERNGAVTLHITRCILIGPPRVGKSCFKHLLVHNEPCLVKESTPIMEAPVVLTSMWTQQGKEGAWKELTRDDFEKLLNKCAMDENYYTIKIEDDNLTAEPLDDEQPKNEGHNSIAEATAVQSTIELKPSPPKIAQTPNPPVSTNEHLQANPAPQQAGLNDKRNSVVPDNLSQRLSKFFHVMSRDDGVVNLNHLKLMHVFDCGGQLTFQDTIPLLINAPCAFIAFFNAFEDLDKEIEFTYCLGGEEQPTGHKETQWNMLLSILCSIQSLQYKCHQDFKDLIKEQPEHYSPIAVVGTHKDKIVHSDIDRIKGSIESKLIDLSDSNPCFFIQRKGQILNLVGNLTTNDLDQVEPLRKDISDNATFGLDLPIPWLILELFTRSRLTEQAFYPYSELKELCRSHPLRMEEDDFDACIRILHILGFYAFYTLSEELSEGENWICTDAATLYKEVSKLLMVQHVKAGNNTTARFQKTGRIPLKEEALKELFKDLKISIRADPKWLMHVLLHLGLAAKIKMKPDSEEEAFIPLALPPGLSDIPSTTSVAPLCFTLDFTSDGCSVSPNSTGIPRGIFSRLVVLLLSDQFPGDVNKWKISDEDSKRSCIKFSLMNSRCAVYLKESMCHIEASVVLSQTMLARRDTDDNRTLEGSRLCQDIRETLRAALKEAFELVFDTSCQPKVVCGLACSKCASSNGYNHLAIIYEPSLSTDERFPTKEYTAVCVFKKADYYLTPDQLIWFNPGPVNPDFKFTYMDENKLWKLEESSTSDSPRTSKRGVGEGSPSEQSPSTTQAKHSARDPRGAEQLHRQEYTQGPHSSPGDAPIEDVAFFLAYIDDMTSHLVILRVVLGLSSFTPPGDSPSDKCINTLMEWLKRTASPTVGKFCKCLEKAPSFNNLRETILRGVSEGSPSTTQAKHSARDPRGAEQLPHRQEYTQGPPAPRTGMDVKIGCSQDILGVPECREGLIDEMKSLGSALGIEKDTKAILNRHGSRNDHLLEILGLYIEVKIPTWQDFCEALKGFDCFNSVRAKIEADHDK